MVFLLTSNIYPINFILILYVNTVYPVLRTDLYIGLGILQIIGYVLSQATNNESLKEEI